MTAKLSEAALFDSCSHRADHAAHQTTQQVDGYLTSCATTHIHSGVAGCFETSPAECVGLANSLNETSRLGPHPSVKLHGSCHGAILLLGF